MKAIVAVQIPLLSLDQRLSIRTKFHQSGRGDSISREGLCQRYHFTMRMLRPPHYSYHFILDGHRIGRLCLFKEGRSIRVVRFYRCIKILPRNAIVPTALDGSLNRGISSATRFGQQPFFFNFGLVLKTEN